MRRRRPGNCRGPATSVQYTKAVREQHQSRHGAFERFSKPAVFIVKDILQKHEFELRRAGVIHVAVAGAIGREDCDPFGTADIFIEVDPSLVCTGGNLEWKLENLLGWPVQITTEQQLLTVVSRAKRELVLIF